jgi:hypothetical protein
MAFACQFLRLLDFLKENEAQTLKPGRYLRYLLTRGGTQLGRVAVDKIWYRRCVRAEQRVKNVEEFWHHFNQGGFWSQNGQDFTYILIAKV